ncbi:MAG TPA: hypothetical protein VGJ78_02335 [Vicinamibacterales bacterium]|jgi:hypothetical protein
MRTNINAPIAFLAAFLTCSCSQPAPSAHTQPSAPATKAPHFTLAGIAERKDTSGMSRGYVGADGKPTILFTDK